MSAHSNGSGPRSNSYSENRFTNWSEYEPWWLEVQAVLKRFDGKIAKRPALETSPDKSSGGCISQSQGKGMQSKFMS